MQYIGEYYSRVCSVQQHLLAYRVLLSVNGNNQQVERHPEQTVSCIRDALKLLPASKKADNEELGEALVEQL